MKASHEKIKKNQEFARDHNSGALDEFVQEKFKEYADCDEKSAVLNDARKKIREEVEEKGLDPKAFVDQYARAKRKRKEKEGYDESQKICWAALNKMENTELFGWLDERDAKREKEAEARDKAKEAAKKQEKKKSKEPNGGAIADHVLADIEKDKE